MALAVCKTLVRTSLSSAASTIRSTTAPSSPTLCLSPRVHSHQASLFLCSPTLAQTLTPAPRLAAQHKLPWTPSASIHGSAVPIEQNAESPDEDNVERLLTHKDDVKFMMKMERRPPGEPNRSWNSGRWFPYLDRFKCGTGFLTSSEVLEATESLIMDSRKERFMKVARNRSYSVCLVAEGLSDFGNVSATFRSADALGFQSVHVVACDSSKRCKGIERIAM